MTTSKGPELSSLETVSSGELSNQRDPLYTGGDLEDSVENQKNRKEAVAGKDLDDKEENEDEEDEDLSFLSGTDSAALDAKNAPNPLGVGNGGVKEELKIKEPEARFNEPVEPASFSGQKFVLSGTGTEVYVTHSPSQRTPRLVILLTNSLGLASENNLKMADEYAKKLKCPVIVPDLFDNDPIRVSGAEVAHMDDEAGLTAGAEQTSIGSQEPSPKEGEETIGQTASTSFFSNLTLSKVKAFATSTIKGFVDEMWIAKHTFERTYPRLTNTVAEIVQVYSPQSLAVIGYSFGGRYVLRLLEDLHHDEWSSEEDLIAVGACIHPSLVEVNDFNMVSKPLMLVYSTDDPILSEKVVQKGIASLQDRNVTFDRKVFTSSSVAGQNSNHKLPHGFAVLGDYPQSEVGNIPTQVVDLVSDWIQVHLSQ
ncbi:hypothetical protein AWJ20_1589 [Sugiyamaella lignohabitans]|uniref:Dienelactone hydrolase domain-containing protein n=1 Tax=Sugiyamaella lignohabitans TaxID=796027 RepID=A0A161HYJ0_9ASCO|nr:uncharacterized protein AWJ20_1589 [Sugiyamaella lignohabitans]ANB13303.1 hypothetical protein AWJ20_1589 [Sugiyamaella lignohabitans]